MGSEMSERRYWWVNHKQTQRQEIEEGFLWSPFQRKDGRANRFYDTMAEARPGDLVLSYAGQVSYVGVVEKAASRSRKPTSFGKKGDAWSNEGWRLPVGWRRLPTSVSIKENKEILRNLWPVKYSPVRALSGYGNQACYLAEVSEQLFFRVCDLGKLDVASIYDSLDYESIQDDDIKDSIIEAAYASGELSDSEVTQLVKSRKGQGKFREAVFEQMSCCPVTGVTNKSLLVASHIRPWRDCDTLKQRLDGKNGLPLSPHIDRLFDRGYISFSDRGELIVSKRLNESVVEAWGLMQKLNQPLFQVSSGQADYLEYHRRHVLKN